ncbi:Protein phosphatase 1L [Podila verticillata]|nr:Protein phosphatase 1L [Podila verticillata]
MDPHLHASALSARSHSLPSPTSPSSSASSIIVVDDSPQAEEAEEEEGEDEEEDDAEGKESEYIDITPTTEESESTDTNTPEPEQPKATDTVPHRSTRRQAHPPPPPSPPSPSPIQDKMSLSSTTSKATGSSNASGEKKLEQEQNNEQEQEPGTPVAEDTEEIIFERRNERPLSEDLVPLEDLPHDEPLPILERFDLATEQLRHPLFVAIAKTLLVQGNAWQSALDLVDGIRHFNLANLGGRTPKGSVQGAISTALTLAHQLKRIEPIEKEKLLNITYYRVAPEVLEDVSTSEPRAQAQSNGTRPRVIQRTVPTRRKPTGTVKRKKKPLSTWESDSLSSDGSLSSGSSDDEVDHRHKLVKSNNSSGRYLDSSSSKRTRAGSSASSTSSPDQMDTIPNGLKKLPKGYVYDTEINQSTLMHLSINPSQTGEFIEHLRNINEKENNFPDRRGEFGLDLTQEPSMFAVEQQTGYAYPRLRNSGRSRLQKEECEDGFAISDLKHNNTFLGRLFCITDGHGGRACSNFVIATIPGAMQVILGKYKPADISLPSVQETIKRQITEALRLIDKEYLEYKKQQYLLFKAKAIPNDPGSDGTTLIVNIFIDKWIINVNLGDSRSMISSRDITGRWNVDFFSEDHTPSLERLVHTIYANGGEFVTHDDKVIRFDPNLKSDKKHRVSLKEARIRVKDAASNAYGIPYRTRNGQCASVNLGACIGDVLYKLDAVNPVLSCTPDVTFIDITKIQQGYLIMASDGLWDYVKRGGKVQDQNAAVSQFVGDKLDRGWNHQRIVCNLSDREGAMALYSDSIQEYDDFTAILVTFNQEQLKLQQQKRREHDEKQKVVQQQQKLMAQQRQKEIEEIQRLQQQQLLMSVEQETDEQETETDVSSVGADSPPSTVPPNDVVVDQSSVASKNVKHLSEE